MDARIVKVSAKGQIAIPTEMRKKVGIKKGTELLVVERHGKILLEPVEFLSKQMEEDFSDMQQHSFETLRTIWDNDEEEQFTQELVAAAKRHGTYEVSPNRSRAGKGASSNRRVKQSRQHRT